ncbi:MAG: ISNCY family transposase [bacterium]
MEKVNLNMNETYKYEVIKKLVDCKGNKYNAALKLHCTIRTINRLIKLYKISGKKGFIHGNKNRQPKHTFDSKVKEKIISLYKNEFRDCNIVHFTEILDKYYDISVSDQTVNNWLRNEYVLSPKARRETKKKMKKIIKQNSKKSINIETIKEATMSIENTNPHPRRPRSTYFGEMIQMDASSFNWFNNEVNHLHLAVDDCTGTVVGAYIDTQETLNGYYNVFSQILKTQGIPAMFYTDRRTVFEYKRKNTALDDEDTFTQFSYACHQLGVAIKTSSVPQAKGRVERLNQTLQSRLPIEFKIAGVKTIEEANEFLNHYVKEYNKQFALCKHSIKSVFEKQPDLDKINRTLAILSKRKVDNGSCIKYKNKYYIPHTNKGIAFHAKRKSDALVIESFDKQLYVSILDQLYKMVEVPTHKKYSIEFDSNIEIKSKKIYIPPMEHPWKHASYCNYLAKQAHRNDSANV